MDSAVEQAKIGWAELGLTPEITSLLEKAGFNTPTAIQEKAIPIALRGQDVIASARTGSGKTAGFGLPLIQKLQGRKGTYALILCPTRELALQTHETFLQFGAPLGVTSAPIIGGVDIKADIAALRSGPLVLIGTPGRINDHLQRGNLWLEYIEYLVLDEADRMLDMGFAKEVGLIVDSIAKKRQTLLFSATFSPVIEKLARKIMQNPERVAVDNASAAAPSIRQVVYWVNEKSKRRALLRFIQKQQGSILIFTRTKDEATKIWQWLHAQGVYDSTYISSNRLQAHRESALQGFKDGQFRVLVATDVAGRGIHVDDIGSVVNYSLPDEPEDYIHRIGRTGRKDSTGFAISFVGPHDKVTVSRIEKMLNIRIIDRFAPDYDPHGDRAPARPARGGSRRPAPRRGRR